MIGRFLIETDWKRRPRQRRSLLRRKKRGDRQNLKIQKKKFKDQVQKQNKTILAVSKYLQMPQNYYCKWLKMFAETSKLLLQVGQNICRCLKIIIASGSKYLQMPQNGGKQPEAGSRLLSCGEGSRGKSRGNWQ